MCVSAGSMCGCRVLGYRNSRVEELRKKIRSRRRADSFVVVEGARAVSETIAAGMRVSSVAISHTGYQYLNNMNLDNKASNGNKAKCQDGKSNTYLKHLEAVRVYLESACGASESNASNDSSVEFGGCDVEVLILADAAFKSLATTVTPQPVLAVASKPRYSLPTRLESQDLVLVMVGVSDPGNAGTIIRAAAACNVRCVVVVGGADPWSTKSFRASSGAVTRVPVTMADDAVDTLKGLRFAGAKVIASSAHMGASYTSGVLDFATWNAPIAIVVGSESHGLDVPALSPSVCGWVRIPMADTSESLNVAMASTLLLYETRRRYL